MRHPIEQTVVERRPESVVTLLLDSGKGAIACESCVVADTPVARMRGLLGRKQLPHDKGILLQPASSIHTAFMRFPIDAVFVDGDLRVLGIRANLRPWRAASCRGAKAVLELAAGEAERRGVEIGDRLVMAEAPPVIDVDLTSLFERVGAVLAGDGDGAPAGWGEIEMLLTEGYAQTLALESERLRIERRLQERRASRRSKRSVQSRMLTERHAEVDRDIHCLRAVLAELYAHGREIRDGARSGEATGRSSRAA